MSEVKTKKDIPQIQRLMPYEYELYFRERRLEAASGIWNSIVFDVCSGTWSAAKEQHFLGHLEMQ